jgi:hypothetical protein
MSLHHLAACERKVSSQNGEDGVIDAIFAEIGATTFAFEFGCAAVECAGEPATQGDGLLMDHFDSQNPLAGSARIRHRREYQRLLDKYQVPIVRPAVIDIDGNDLGLEPNQAAAAGRDHQYNAHVSLLCGRLPTPSSNGMA